MKDVEIARARHKVLAAEVHGGHSTDWRKGGIDSERLEALLSIVGACWALIRS